MTRSSRNNNLHNCMNLCRFSFLENAEGLKLAIGIQKISQQHHLTLPPIFRMSPLFKK